jgi:hypothetical protein
MKIFSFFNKAILETIGIFFLCILMGALGSLLTYAIIITDIQEDYQSSLRMLNATLESTTQEAIHSDNYLGAYYKKKQDYYCVSTYNKAADEIATSEQHEICHALIKKDKEHFCTTKEALAN